MNYLTRFISRFYVHAEGNTKTADVYRHVQMISVLLNRGFKLYLAWFSTLLLGIVALLVFSLLTFWDLSIMAYIMFPICSLRCIFESITLLSLAGVVNEESLGISKIWEGKLQAVKDAAHAAWLRAFQRSAPHIKIKAGTYFTFENSIVLTATSNCVDLIINLIVLHREE